MSPISWPFSYDIFRCHHCGENWTHHNKIEIFARKEDDTKGIHTIIQNFDADSTQRIPNFDAEGRLLDDQWDFENENNIKKMSITTDDDVSKCPGRRSAIIITIWCENCGKESILSIHQYKGETQICGMV